MARAQRVKVLSLDGVHAAYGPYRALHGLTLDVEAGESVALLGRNGAGKSTVARVASALTPISSGRLEVLGLDASRCSPHALARAGVAHLPEGVGLFSGLSVEENLVVRSGGRNRDERRERLDRAMELLPAALRERRRTRAGALSGGQQRLVAVAAVLAAAPKLLLADEPALGLAPAAADDVYGALASARDASSALVVIEPRLDRVAPLCRRAVVLHKGRVAADTTIDDVAAIRAALLGASVTATG